MIDNSVRVGFWPRVGASLLDTLIMVVVFAIGAAPVIYLETQARLTPGLEYVFGIAMSVGLLAYWTFEIFKAATPGKIILGQRIVTVDGAPPSTGALVSRFMVKHLPELIGLAAAITALQLLDKISNLLTIGVGLAALGVLGATRQAVWDEIAGTIVMRTKDVQEIPGFQPLMAPSPFQVTAPIDAPPPPAPPMNG